MVADIFVRPNTHIFVVIFVIFRIESALLIVSITFERREGMSDDEICRDHKYCCVLDADTSNRGTTEGEYIVNKSQCKLKSPSGPCQGNYFTYNGSLANADMATGEDVLIYLRPS